MESIIQTLAVFALVFGAMVIIHEFGHFVVARLFGVRVDVFSVGFGKRIWGVRRGSTDYRVSLIPLGGYVKMAGENLDEQVTGAPDEFMSKPKWQRFCVAVAGPTMNILTALAIPMVSGMIHYEMPAFLHQAPLVNAVEPGSAAERAGIQPGDLIVRIGDEVNPTWQDVQDRVALNPDQVISLTVKRGDKTTSVTLQPSTRTISQEKIGDAGIFPDPGANAKMYVSYVMPDSPAGEAGLKPGDQIVAINDKVVEQDFNGKFALNQEIKGSNGQPVTMTIVREGQTLNVQATPRLIQGELRLGFNHQLRDVDRIITRLGPLEAFRYSLDTNVRTVRLTRDALAQVFSGRRSVRDTFTGPVGIFVMTGQAAEQGTGTVLELMALLSLNLGLINLLPIPVLDGGLIFMLALEGLLGLFGLPLTLQIKERMMKIGFVVIMLLMAFVIFNDISKQFPGRSASQSAAEQKAEPEKPDK